MQKTIEKNTVPKFLFPELIKRHLEQPKTLTTYYKQAHEIYMYTFFYKATLSGSKHISINGEKGTYISDIDCVDIVTKQQASETDFFNMLRYAPAPFLFIPENSKRLIKGAAHFKNGIIMDVDFATNLGVDFVGGDFIMQNPVTNYYIGFVYDEDIL